MSPTPIDERIETTLSQVRSELQLEQQRLESEVQAYSEFATQLESVPVTDPSPVSTAGAIRIDNGSPTDHCRDIKEAFETTVMDVPHYTEDYDESFLEHFATEFTPEVATLVVQSNEIPPQLYSTLRSEVATAITDRQQLTSDIDAEQDAVTDLGDRLLTCCQQLSTIDSMKINQLDFGGLESHWMYLAQQHQNCDEIAIDRQQQLARMSRTLGLANSTSDFFKYLYQELEETYPLLAKIAVIGETIQRYQTQIESAIVNCD